MRLILGIMLFSFLAHAGEPEQVCLHIDQFDTGNKDYPNQATEVENHLNSFYVYHEQIACFDLDKSYYMQYFLLASRNTVIYGTRCKYEPKLEDEGRVLVYKGDNGGTPCPILDDFHIEN